MLYIVGSYLADLRVSFDVGCGGFMPPNMWEIVRKFVMLQKISHATDHSVSRDLFFS